MFDVNWGIGHRRSAFLVGTAKQRVGGWPRRRGATRDDGTGPPHHSSYGPPGAAGLPPRTLASLASGLADRHRLVAGLGSSKPSARGKPHLRLQWAREPSRAVVGRWTVVRVCLQPADLLSLTPVKRVLDTPG